MTVSRPLDWVPVRWPSDWKPEALSLLESTPFNCVVIDEGQRASATPLIERAQKQGVAVVTLGGVLSGDIPAIPAFPISKWNNAATGDVVAISDASWPGIPMRKSDGGDSGPTGLPWVDSNGWVSLLAHAKAPGKSIWIDAAPPKDGPVLRPDNYLLAVADSGAYGSRWIVTLHSKLAAGVGSKTDDALAVWRSIAQSASFFEKQKQWRTFHPAAALGIVSDFEGPNEFLGTELLNLTPRRQLQYRVIDIRKGGPRDITGLKAVVWVDQKAPAGDWAQAIKGFVSSGGTLIGPASMQHFADGLRSAGVFDGRYNLAALGSGRFAIAMKPWSDPYQLAADTHLLLTRRYDEIRLWNSGTTNALYKTGPNGQAVVQILNFAARSFGSPVSLYVAHPYKTVKWSTLPSGASETLPVARKQEGIEIAIPPFQSYGAVELGD